VLLQKLLYSSLKFLTCQKIKAKTTVAPELLCCVCTSVCLFVLGLSHNSRIQLLADEQHRQWLRFSRLFSCCCKIHRARLPICEQPYHATCNTLPRISDLSSRKDQVHNLLSKPNKITAISNTKEMIYARFAGRHSGILQTCAALLKNPPIFLSQPCSCKLARPIGVDTTLVRIK
jgi:hypothetical protein